MRRLSLRRRNRTGANRLEMLESRVLLSGVITSTLGFGSSTVNGNVITGTATDAQGITYITGYYSGTMDIDPSAGTTILTSKGQRDIFLAAFQAGNLVWAKSFGGTGDDISSGLLLYQNNLYVIGSFTGTMDADPGAGTVALTSAGGTDVLLSRFTTSGNLVWAKSFGGTGADAATRIVADAANPGAGPGSFYLVGNFAGTADLDPGSGVHNLTAGAGGMDDFISKVDTNGNLVWVNDYRFNDTLSISGIAVDAATDHIYIGGHFRGTFDVDGTSATDNLTSGVNYSAFVAQLNSDGTLNWAKTFGDGTGVHSNIVVMDLDVDAQGNLLICGDFGGTVDVDPSSAVHNITETISPNGMTGFLLKLDSAGNYVWSGALTGDSWSDMVSVNTDEAGNVYVTGEFNHISDFDFGPGVHAPTAPQPWNTAYVAKYDSSGRFLWEQHADGGVDTSLALNVAIGPADSLVVTGYYNTSIAFPTTTGNPPVTSDVLLTAPDQDANFMLFITQVPDAPSIALTPSRSTIVAGQHVTLTASVTAGSGGGQPGGMVTFKDGSAVLGQVTLNASGGATFDVVPALGTHSFTVVYGGDSNFATATSSPAGVTANADRLPVGNLDSSANGILSGWAADLDDPGTPTLVQIWVDGALRFTMAAANSRPDLQSTVGGTLHGFFWQLPPLLAGMHAVQVVTYDLEKGTGVVLANLSMHIDSLYFDPAWYLSTYPDVAAAVAAGQVASAWQHFITTGAHEGRSPSAYFNEMWYRQQNADVAAAIAAGTLRSGFDHFVASGAHEGAIHHPCSTRRIICATIRM